VARQKTCKTLLQVKQSFVIHLAVPIWISDRLEAFAVAALWRNKLSHSVLRFFAANDFVASCVSWLRNALFLHRGLQQVEGVPQANIP
jgi:hypothetical protein